MDKLGKAEITNNIYALAIQTSDGNENTFTSRLEASNKYAAIFNKTAQGRAGASGDVFVQLGMYSSIWPMTAETIRWTSSTGSSPRGRAGSTLTALLPTMTRWP